MADNFTAKDSAGVAKTFRSTEISGNIQVPHKILSDSAGDALIGQKALSASLPVVLPSNMPLLGMGLFYPVSTFTRPADTTAYASGDLVADNTTAGSVTALSWTATRIAAGAASITGGRISKTNTSTTNAQFRLHLYASAPTCANGDNGAWSTDGGGATPIYLGSMDCIMDRAFTDGASGDLLLPAGRSAIGFKLASGTSIKGLLEARAAYTPASAEQFAVTLEIVTT